MFHELDLLESHGMSLKLINRVAGKWEEVAIRLHFSADRIEVLRRDSHHQCDPACRNMFTRWLDGEGREPRTWGTLIATLNEANLSTVAHELDKMINASQHVN